MREVTLWRAVILQALMDASSRAYGSSAGTAADANEWFGSRDFKIICELADITPSCVMQLYERFKATGVLNLPKQGRKKYPRLVDDAE